MNMLNLEERQRVYVIFGDKIFPGIIVRDLADEEARKLGSLYLVRMAVDGEVYERAIPWMHLQERDRGCFDDEIIERPLSMTRRISDAGYTLRHKDRSPYPSSGTGERTWSSKH